MQVWSWIPPTAEAGCGISDIGGTSPMDFDGDPQACRDATSAVAVPSLPGPGLGRGAVMNLSVAPPVPSGASSSIPWLSIET